MSNYASKSQMIEIMSDAASKIDTKLATKVTKVDGKGLSTNDYTNDEKTKLAGLSNYDDTEIKQAIDDKLDANLKGAAGGVAELGSDGKVPSTQLPSYVDETIEGYLNPSDGKFYEHKSDDGEYSDEIAGASSVIYVDLNTENTFRWSGTQFTEISPSIALGETSSTAYPGNKGAKNASDISDLQSGKVDKVTGKGLSTNDFDDDAKNKLDGISDLSTDDVAEVKSSFTLA